MVLMVSVGCNRLRIVVSVLAVLNFGFCHCNASYVVKFDAVFLSDGTSWSLVCSYKYCRGMYFSNFKGWIKSRPYVFSEILLGAFSKLRKITISFVLPVRPSISLSKGNNLAPSGRIYMKFGILMYIQQDTALHSLFYMETALLIHVSGCTTTHYQERKQLYLQNLVFVTPLLLPAAIVEELELVWVCCGWHTHTRFCRYSCLHSWWWVVVPPEMCRAVSR